MIRANNIIYITVDSYLSWKNLHQFISGNEAVLLLQSTTGNIV